MTAFAVGYALLFSRRPAGAAGRVDAASRPDTRRCRCRSAGPLGPALLAVGAVIVASGVVSLRKHGGGLPMSPLPPPRLATRGAYAIVANPIYAGSACLCAGAAVALGSPAGIWIVTPVFVAAMVAFVTGYERDATVARFGPRPRPLLHLPDGRLGRFVTDALVAVGLVIAWSLLVPAVSPVHPVVLVRHRSCRDCTTAHLGGPLPRSRSGRQLVARVHHRSGPLHEPRRVCRRRRGGRRGARGGDGRTRPGVVADWVRPGRAAGRGGVGAAGGRIAATPAPLRLLRVGGRGCGRGAVGVGCGRGSLAAARRLLGRCLRHAGVRPDALPGAGLLSRASDRCGVGYPLHAPEVARAAPDGPGRRDGAPHAALRNRLVSRDVRRSRSALDARRAARIHRRRVSRSDGTDPLRRGALPRRAADRVGRRAPALPVAGHRLRGGRGRRFGDRRGHRAATVGRAGGPLAVARPAWRLSPTRRTGWTSRVRTADSRASCKIRECCRPCCWPCPLPSSLPTFRR